MSAVISPESLADPRLAVYADLRDMDLRKSLETTHGIFMAEGEKIILRALENGLTSQSFLLSERWLDRLRPYIQTLDAACFVLPESEIEQLTGFHVHRGALAVFERPAPRKPQELLCHSKRVLVLEDLADHTNVGAIFRTAAALSWDAVLLSPRCADPWYRRAIKVSMGAVFSMPFAWVDDWYELPELLARHDFHGLAMTLSSDSRPLNSLELRDSEKLALIVGSEGYGLSNHWQSQATTRVTIPMAETIDSLNVAASVAIACWELRSV